MVTAQKYCTHVQMILIVMHTYCSEINKYKSIILSHVQYYSSSLQNCSLHACLTLQPVKEIQSIQFIPSPLRIVYLKYCMFKGTTGNEGFCTVECRHPWAGCIVQTIHPSRELCSYFTDKKNKR